VLKFYIFHGSDFCIGELLEDWAAPPVQGERGGLREDFDRDLRKRLRGRRLISPHNPAQMRDLVTAADLVKEHRDAEWCRHKHEPRVVILKSIRKSAGKAGMLDGGEHAIWFANCANIGFGESLGSAIEFRDGDDHFA
jgi:hypothetical protein